MNFINLIIQIISTVFSFSTFFQSINCNFSSTNGDFRSDRQIEEIRQDFDLLAKDFLESLKVAHNLVDHESDQNEDELHRSKRSPQLYQRKINSFYNKGVFRLRGLVPFHSTCVRSLDFKTIGFYGFTYGICISQSTLKTPAKVSVGPITHNGWQPDVISWFVRDPKGVVAFVDEDIYTKDRNLYLLVADSGSRDGTDVVVINKHNQRLTKEQHTVNSRYPTAIEVWKSRIDNTYRLAIANSYGTEKTQTYRSETFTYNWMQTYFDRYSEMTTFYVKDICAFNVYSNEFLAVANFMAGPNNMEVDSEIFKLDIDRKKWRSFQRIRTSGAVDMEFFTLGPVHNEEYFLAVANSFNISRGHHKYDINSVIYKFSDNKFVPFQCLLTVGATQIKTFRGPNGEFVLAMANMHQSIHLYQYNGLRFVETSVQHKSGVLSGGVVSINFDYLAFDKSGVLFVSNPSHPSGHIYKMDFVYENPMAEWHNKSLKWCQTTEQEINKMSVNNISLFKDVFYVDQNQPIVINEDLNIENLIADNLNTPLILDLSTNDELSHRLVDELAKLDNEINVLETKLAQIIDILSNGLRTSGDQVVTAPQSFKSVDFECRPEFNCNLGQINAKVLNDDNINGLAEDILLLNVDQTIDHSMHFQNLRVDNNIRLDGVINDLNTNHIVTKHGSHDILASKTFLNDVTANEVVVNHVINDKFISPSTVLLTVGDQIINNSIKFSDKIQLSNLQVNGPINGINIEHFFRVVITTDGDHIIRGEKHFNQLEMTDLLMAPNSTIDGIDIMSLWNDILWTYGDQEVTAPINFTNIAIDSNLIVDGLINGVRIPDDLILVNENGNIFGNKQFNGDIKVRRMEIFHSINGIGFVNTSKPELDIMLKSKQQTVVGHKVFHGIHLSGHSLVWGTVDGVKLSELRRILLMRNNSQNFDEIHIKGDVFFDGGLQLKNTINGIRLEELYNNALKLSDKFIPAFPDFQMNVINTKLLESHSINGLNIGNDLMTRNTRQTISGLKVFMNGIILQNNLNVGIINGIPMNFFNDTLLHDSEQFISGVKTFISDLWVKNLNTKAINNISMDDIVLLNSDQTIASQKDFNDIQIYNDLNVHSLESNIINDIQMKEFFENSLQFEKPQIITGRLNFHSIVIPKGTNFETKFVNGIDLKKLISDAVFKDTNQLISAPKTFLAPIRVEKMNFINNFDGVTDFDLKHNWLLQDVPQVINSTTIFERDLKVDNNIVMKVPVINNINLALLNNSAVKLDEPALITGNSHFIGPVISEGHIYLNGRIQGIDLDKEAVTLDGNHTIFGEIHFANGFEVDEHLFTRGTIDGVRVEGLCQFAVRKNVNQLITGPTTVTGDLLIKGPLDVNLNLNNINIGAFNRSVLKRDEPSTIKGVTHFRQLIIDGPVVSNQMFAGFRVDKLYNNYMSLSRDQIVKSRIVFLNDIHLKSLDIIGHVFTQNSLINGIDLPLLERSVLKTYGNQIITGDFTFEDNVYFDSDLNIGNQIINNLNLNRDLMLKGRNNVITVPKIFAENITVITKLDIREGKTIGGIDLSEMAKYSVLKTKGKYQITGHNHFNSLEVDHLKVKRINGIEISDRTLLLKSVDQRVDGFKVLRNGLTVNNEIFSNLINNINIVKLSQNLVLKGYNNSINSFKTFNSSVFVNNVKAFGRVDGVDLNELNYFIRLPIDLLDLRINLGIEDQKIKEMERALQKQSIHLEFYELVSVIHSGSPLLSYFNNFSGTQHLFISGQHLSNGCHEVDVYLQRINDLKLFNKLYAIEAILMTTFHLNENNFIVISNSKKAMDSTHCLKINESPNVSYFGRGPAISQVFVFDTKANHYKQMAIIYSETVTDIKVIEDQNLNTCLILAIPVTDGSIGHPIVVCMRPNGSFFLKETTPLLGIDQISIVRSFSLNRTLMASINSWEISDWMSNIVISDWSSKLAHFDHSIQLIPFLNPSAVHLVESTLHSSVFLFASEKKTSLTHSPLVRVFRYSPRKSPPFVEVQHIKDSEVKQIDSVLLNDYKVLVLMLTNDKLDLYQLKGSSGFVKIDTINVQNAQNFIVSNSFKGNTISGHFISILLKLCYAKNIKICKEETHVLRPKFNIN